MWQGIRPAFWPAMKNLRNFRPTVTKPPVQVKQKPVLRLRPRRFLHVRIQVVVPPVYDIKQLILTFTSLCSVSLTHSTQKQQSIHRHRTPPRYPNVAIAIRPITAKSANKQQRTVLCTLHHRDKIGNDPKIWIKGASILVGHLKTSIPRKNFRTS